MGFLSSLISDPNCPPFRLKRVRTVTNRCLL
ncbi:Uncharacterised protein [Vibrio cholerae]|nr:Uncharacterised protein [Vibrio cholerae]CSI45575.1 Uncharacterised protein [Vibrio cholerae]